MALDEHDCLVILHISSTRITVTVAWRQEHQGEQVGAHRVFEFDWWRASDQDRRRAVVHAMSRIAEDADLASIHTAFVCVTDQTLRANFATGFAEPGSEIVFGEEERQLALVRSMHQPIGTGRMVVHALPQRWGVRNRTGEVEVDDPVGQRGSRLNCNVLLVTMDLGLKETMESYLGDCGIHLESLLAPPVALHRGLAGILPKRGSTVIIDCGARQTSILVHRKERLVHIETHRFGGDDLTQALVQQLALTLDQAELLKHEVNLGNQGGKRDVAGQNYLWNEVQERYSLLGQAVLICGNLLRQFFAERARHLRELALLAQQGRVYLVGRGAALGGLAGLIQEIFDLETVLGTQYANREIHAELSDLITVGLIRAASDVRTLQLAERRRSSGFYHVTSAASGVWTWLTQPFH